MVLQDYHLGDQNGNLLLEVNVGTPGIANTVVFRFKDNQKVKLGGSNVDSGNIGQFNAGPLTDFTNSRIKVRTIVDFAALPPAQWTQLAENVVMTLRVSGGFDGVASFEYDDQDKSESASGKVVVIDINIKFI